jgi:hypothetical protein
MLTLSKSHCAQRKFIELPVWCAALCCTCLFVPCAAHLPATALQERFDYIRSQLLPFLKTVGFRESSVQWLPAVGPAGQNLVAAPSEPLLSRWWRGPTLVQAIDAFTPKPRNTGELGATDAAGAVLSACFCS